MINRRLLSKLERIDWDFPGSYSDSRFSAVHWHPGRFASQLPAAFIGLLSEAGGLVLDPFAGSGTTLVEAQRLGRASIGIDINPVSCLVTRAKVVPRQASAIQRSISWLKRAAGLALTEDLFTRPRRIETPPTVQVSKWYTQAVGRDLGRLWHHISKCRGVRADLATTAFSSILLPVCRETRHWGYVCDNTRPVSNHGEHVLPEYKSVLDSFARSYIARDRYIHERTGSVSISPAQVVQGSAVDVLHRLPRHSIDLVMTSPPYFGVCDYIKSQRLTFEWLGQEIEPLRREELGARSKRHRRSALDEYLGELSGAFVEIRRVLRPGAPAVFVIGESSSRSPVFDSVKAALREKGFTIGSIFPRRVSAQRRLHPSIEDEYIVLCYA